MTAVMLISVSQGEALHRGIAQVIAFADLPIDTEHWVSQIFAGATMAEEHDFQVRLIVNFRGFGPCQAWLSIR
jgi:hypothetical protein